MEKIDLNLYNSYQSKTNKMSTELKEIAVNVEPTYLAEKNAHLRDKDMQFIENTHKYIIVIDPDSKYDSVTTWNHSHFGHFNAALIIKNMMKDYKTKDISGEEKVEKPQEEILQEFHFSGEGVYEPIVIKAHNTIEAEELYETKKVKIIN